MRDATLMKDMTLEGIAGIVEGLNPTLIRMKLEAYNPHPEKVKKSREARAPEPARKPKTAAQPAAAQI